MQASGLVFIEISHTAQIDRARLQFAESALIALVPASRPDLRAAAEAAGFRGCLSTPLEAPALLDLVEGLLGSSSAAVETSMPLGRAAIDLRALEDLAGLGGAEFVRDIVGQFLDDAASILKALNHAMRAGDASAFRDQAHALRSCAANVGASSLFTRCLELRGIEPRELAEVGEAHMRQLEMDVTRAREALASYIGADTQA